MRHITEPSITDPLAHTVDEAVRRSRIGRNCLYQFMASGRLKYLKIGKRRLIRDDALAALLRELEAETVTSFVTLGEAAERAVDRVRSRQKSGLRPARRP